MNKNIGRNGTTCGSRFAKARDPQVESVDNRSPSDERRGPKCVDGIEGQDNAVQAVWKRSMSQ